MSFSIQGKYTQRDFIEFCFRSEFQFEVSTTGPKGCRVCFYKGDWTIVFLETDDVVDRITFSDAPSVQETTNDWYKIFLEQSFIRHLEEKHDPCRWVPAKAAYDLIEFACRLDKADHIMINVVQPHRDGSIGEDGKFTFLYA